MWRKTESWSAEGLVTKNGVKLEESESGASWDVRS